MRRNRYKLQKDSKRTPGKGCMKLSKRLMIDKSAKNTLPTASKPNVQLPINNQPTHDAETSSAKDNVPKNLSPPNISANEAPSRGIGIDMENLIPERDIEIDVYGPWTEEDEKNYWSEIIIT